MAGHSKFKNIQHRKGIQDKKKAKIFTKLTRDISIAASTNTDPDFNPRLRNAILVARAQNLPKERIDRAIIQVQDLSKDSDYIEIRYEGFAQEGVAFIIEALTDNKNRTASEVRSLFSKYGANLGETGNVSFMFSKKGFMIYNQSIGPEDKIFESLIECGADDIESIDEQYVINCAGEKFYETLDKLIDKFNLPEESYIGWKPQSIISINDRVYTEKLHKLTQALEDNEYVQRVFHNYRFCNN